MRVFPSMLAAIVTGLLATPVLILGWKFIEQRTQNQLFPFCWAVIAFFIPVFFATVDREYMARRRREAGFLASFIRPASIEAFRGSYFPTWRRMGVWFAASVTSLLALKLFGVSL
jgi:hypothetical protein